VKYFTKEWWDSGCEDESVFFSYREYYKSISSKLPEKLRILHEKHTLHDSIVTGIYSDFSARAITMKLSGWDQDFKVKTNYVLRFVGVIEFNQVFPDDKKATSVWGDLGYVEYELLETGIEMRMLFDSDVEFRVLFKDFDFESTALL